MSGAVSIDREASAAALRAVEFGRRSRVRQAKPAGPPRRARRSEIVAENLEPIRRLVRRGMRRRFRVVIGRRAIGLRGAVPFDVVRVHGRNLRCR